MNVYTTDIEKGYTNKEIGKYNNITKIGMFVDKIEKGMWLL